MITLSEALIKQLLSDTHFTLTNGDRTLDHEQCLIKIRQYMAWIEQLNVKSVMLIGPPTIESVCMCYALVISNKTYVPVHVSIPSELLEKYLTYYNIDILLTPSPLNCQIDASLKSLLTENHEQDFSYYVPQAQKTLSIERNRYRGNSSALDRVL